MQRGLGQCRSRLAVLASTIVAATGFAASGIAGAAADDFPQRPIKWVLPYGASSASDLMIRAMTPKLSKLLGQQVIVDNRPGGGGNVAAQIAARAPADGYTVFLGSSASHAANPHLFNNLPYDPFKDFTAVSGVAAYSFVLVVPGSTPTQTVPDLVKQIKSTPYPVPYASSGVAASSHIIGIAFARELGVEMTHVPYNAFSQAFVELITNKTSLMFYVFNALEPFLKSGQLRALATTGATRAPFLPNVPTMQEAGFPGFVWTSWLAMHAPAGTPAPVIEKLYRAVTEMQQDREVADSLLKQGVQMMPMSPAELEKFGRTENERYKRLFTAAGIKAQ